MTGSFPMMAVRESDSHDAILTKQHVPLAPLNGQDQETEKTQHSDFLIPEESNLPPGGNLLTPTQKAANRKFQCTN
jgi:hypothetical protein